MNEYTYNQTPLNFTFSISRAFSEGQLKPGYTQRAYGDSFKPVDGTIESLAAHILSGGAIVPGQFRDSGSRTNENFTCTQVLALDFDHTVSVADLLAIPFVKQYAAIIHPTKSSGLTTEKNPDGGHRSRLVFVLDQPIYGVEPVRALIRAVCDYIGLEYDPASYKPAQLFFGSLNTIETPHINEAAMLPVTLAVNLMIDHAQADYDQATAPRPERKPVARNSSRAERYAAAAYDDALQTIAGAPDGSKNNLLFKGACELFSMADWPGISTGRIESDLEAIYSRWPNVHKSRSTVASAKRTAQPRPLELPDHEPKAAPKPLAERVRKINLTGLRDPHPVNISHVSNLDQDDLLKYLTLLIRSSINTGKTELAARLIAHLERILGYKPNVLVLTHRESLARNIAERLDIECYKDIDPDWLRSAPQLVLCVNSAHKLLAPGQPLPHYDLVIIDEIEQFLRHLGGGTFKGPEARRAYLVLRELVKQSKWAIGMDAHAGHVSQTWLEGIRGDVTAIDNQHRPAPGDLHLHDHPNYVIGRALALAEAGEGCVVIPVSSKALARKIERIAVKRLGGEGVRLICSDNSHSAETQAFISSINEGIKSLKLLIYTPSLGTGVDIKTPVRAVCGVFKNVRGLGAPDYLQMLGRCRYPQETHAYVQPVEGYDETDASAIYKRELTKAEHTGAACNFNEAGIWAVNDVQKSMLRLLSMIQAEQNRSTNNLLSHFVALAVDGGYKVDYHDGDDPGINKALAEAGEEVAQETKEAVLAAAPVDDDAIKHHREKGTLTDAHRAGNERWKIENTIGLPITSDLYDEFHTSDAKTRFLNRCDLEDSRAAVVERDRKQASNEHLITRRGHYTMRRALVNQLLRDVFGEQGRASTERRRANEIDERMENFKTLWGDQLRLYFDKRRIDHSDKSIAVLRWILKQYDIQISSQQVMRDGERFYEYFIDQEHEAERRELVMARLAHLAALKAQQAEKSNYLKPVLGQIYPPEVTTRQPLFEPPEAHSHSQPAQYVTALLQSGRPVNPFSRGA